MLGHLVLVMTCPLILSPFLQWKSIFGTLNRKTKKEKDPNQKGKGRGKNSKVNVDNEEMSDLEEQELEAEIRLLDEIDHDVELEDILEETEITAELQSSSQNRDVCPITVKNSLCRTFNQI